MPDANGNGTNGAMTPLRGAIVVLLGVALVTGVVALVRDYRQVRARNGFAVRGESRLSPANPDPDAIEAWMTFEYVDHVFGLPPQALRDALAVTDPRYPRISVRRYARDAGLTPADALAKVKDAVRALRAGANP